MRHLQIPVLKISVPVKAPVLAAALSFGAVLASAWVPALAQGAATAPKRMALSSYSFQDGGIIPDKFTQASKQVPMSPELSWTGVPDGTKSFALILDDPDTAMGRTTNEVLHWAAFNLPGTMRDLPADVPPTPKLPDGTIQVNNTGKQPGYMGPGAGCCVYHHYTFQLYALDTMLNLGPDATRAQILHAMDGHVLAKAVLVGRFHKPMP